MGIHLEWYRREICTRERHTHGYEGELECLLTRLAQLRAAEQSLKGRTP